MLDRSTWTVPLWPLGDRLDTIILRPRRDPEAWPTLWGQLPDAWRAAILGAGVSPAEALPPLMRHASVELQAWPAGHREEPDGRHLPLGPVRLVAVTSDGDTNTPAHPHHLGEGGTVLAFEALARGRGSWVPLELALWTPGMVPDPTVAVSPSLAAWVALGGAVEREGLRRRLSAAAVLSPDLVVHRVRAELHPGGQLLSDAPPPRKTRRR